MRKTIYIESDEEITSIIDKLKKADTQDIAIVAPKGALLLQSLVNLRLLKRQAEKSKAQIDIVTTDQVGTNLATQAGLTVFKSLKDSSPVSAVKEPPKNEVLHADQDTEVKPDFAVNYYKDKAAQEDEVAEAKDNQKEQEDQPAKEQEPAKSKDEPSDEVAFSSKSIDETAEDLDELEEGETLKDDGVKEASGFVSRSAGALHSKASFETKAKQEHSSEKDHQDTASAEPSSHNSAPTNPSGGSFTRVSAQKHKKRAVYSAIIGVLAILIIATAYLLIPRANINILVKEVAFDQKVPTQISVETQTNQDAVVLTGTSLKLSGETSAEFKASGKREVGEKAKGEATISNSEDTLTHTYPAGTRFTTMGKVFVNTKAVTVPGATVVSGAIRPGTVKVELEATAAGEDYNVGAAKFVISGAPAKIFAESTTAFAGGSSRQLTIVSQADITEAQTAAVNQLTDELITKLQADNESLFIHKEAVVLDAVDFSSSDNVGSEAESFTMTVSALATVLAYDKERLLALAQEKASLDLAEQERIELDEQLTAISFSSINEQGDLLLSVNLVGNIVPKYDEKQLAREIKGKSEDETKQMIMAISDSIEQVEIDRFPAFWRFNPLLPSNISIKINFE